MKKTAEKTESELNAKLDEYINENRELRGEVERLSKVVETLEDQKAMDQKKKKEEDDEKRSRNIIIKGVPEQLNEKMYLTMTELINILGCTFPYSLTNGGFRIGKLSNVKKGGDSYPRNIKLRLQTTQQKSEMFGLKDNLKKSMKFEKVIFANDLSSDDLLTYKEVQTLYNATKCIGQGVSQA